MNVESKEVSTFTSILPGNVNYFDFEDFCRQIELCVSGPMHDKEDVEIKFYLLAYDQLYNFFLLLGRAFYFVASDVKSKIKILNKFQADEINHFNEIRNFQTVKTMINYELNSHLLGNPKYVSGSRTLLRLHRGLDFVRKFLYEIYNLEENARLSLVARNVYDQTLAEYHTFIVRNAARVSMQFLPTREELLSRISGNDEEKLSQILELFPSAVDNMNIAYDRMQYIYCTNELLNLP